MQDENQTVTQAEPEGKTVAQPEPNTLSDQGTEQNVEPQAETQVTEGEKAPRKPWWQDRIDTVTRQRHDAERRASDLAAENARLKNGGQSSGAEQVEPDIEALVEKKAIARAWQTQFDADCNRIADQAFSKYPDFAQAHQTLNAVGATPAFYDVVRQIDEAPDVLYHLGKNPDQASRIIAMHPLAQMKELVRLSQTVTKQPARGVSSAKPPVNPIGGSSTPAEKPPEKMSQQEFDEWREKNRKTRK